MQEVRICQKDSLTHTAFMVLPGGECFPDSNFEIARGWMDDGLLSEPSLLMMEKILHERQQSGSTPNTTGGEE